MTKNLRPWFYSANILINGSVCRFSCGIVYTTKLGENLITELNNHIIEAENKRGSIINNTNIHILALNRAD